jgi:predicted DNA-binding protein YlxM (UPF0122 family)
MKKKKDLKKDIDTEKMLSIKEPTSDDLSNDKLSLMSIKHQRVIHMYLSGGYSTQDIATALGYSKQYVTNLLCSPDIKNAINEFQKQEDELILQSIKALRVKAMQKMGQLIDSNMDAIAYQASRDILDRTGFKGVDKKEVNVNVTFEQQLKEVLSEEDIIELKEFSVEDGDD